MAKKSSKKGTKSKLIGLVSVLTGYRIYKKVNKQNNPEPFEAMGYDKLARKHVLFKETKKNLGRNVVKERKH